MATESPRALYTGAERITGSAAHDPADPGDDSANLVDYSLDAAVVVPEAAVREASVVEVAVTEAPVVVAAVVTVTEAPVVAVVPTVAVAAVVTVAVAADVAFAAVAAVTVAVTVTVVESWISCLGRSMSRRGGHWLKLSGLSLAGCHERHSRAEGEDGELP